MKILLAIMITMMTSCSLHNPCEGRKIGYIVKLAEEGVLFKTTEGELVRGGLQDGTGTLGGSFNFVIKEYETKKLAEYYMRNNIEVIISYKIPMLGIKTQFESEPNFVYDIKPVSAL